MESRTVNWRIKKTVDVKILLHKSRTPDTRNKPKPMQTQGTQHIKFSLPQTSQQHSSTEQNQNRIHQAFKESGQKNSNCISTCQDIVKLSSDSTNP